MDLFSFSVNFPEIKNVAGSVKCLTFREPGQLSVNGCVQPTKSRRSKNLIWSTFLLVALENVALLALTKEIRIDGPQRQFQYNQKHPSSFLFLRDYPYWEYRGLFVCVSFCVPKRHKIAMNF